MDAADLSGRLEWPCHLDVSVRPQTIAALAADLGLNLPAPVRQPAVAPLGIGSLHAFLPYIDVTPDVPRTPEGLHRAAAELVADRHDDHVVHGEVHQHLDASLAVADAAVRGPEVAGRDRAGDGRHAGARHREPFALTHAAGLPVSVYAGEATGPADVWEALDVLGARRNGHGVRRTVDRASLITARTTAARAGRLP